MDAVGSGSSAASVTLRSSASRAAPRSPRARATSPTSRSASPARCGSPARTAAARAPAAVAEAIVEVAGHATRRCCARPAPARAGRHGGRRGERGLEVAGRGREVAAPAMDATEGDLDRRQLGRTGKGRGRLECGDRAGILAQARAQLADPGMGRGRVRVARAPATHRDGRSPRGSRRPPRPSPRPRGRPRRPPRDVRPRARARAIRAKRAIGSWPVVAWPCRSASAVRRWSSRRRARLVAS